MMLFLGIDLDAGKVVWFFLGVLALAWSVSFLASMGWRYGRVIFIRRLIRKSERAAKKGNESDGSKKR